jgi:hypothetical protein
MSAPDQDINVEQAEQGGHGPTDQSFCSYVFGDAAYAKHTRLPGRKRELFDPSGRDSGLVAPDWHEEAPPV